MIEAILSFLGGSTLRMVWGEVSAYLTRKQDHQHEVERIRAVLVKLDRQIDRLTDRLGNAVTTRGRDRNASEGQP